MRKILTILVVILGIVLSGYVAICLGQSYIQKNAAVLFDFLVKRPDKAWLHMVNSPEKVVELQSRYRGLEMDVIFHDDVKGFENSHSPTSLEKFPLEATLSKVDTKQIKGLWIDFKNLTESNREAALEELNRLILRKGFSPSQIIVESPNWRSLGVFREAGYQTSFYLPRYTQEQLAQGNLEAQIKQAVESGNIDYVSFNARYYKDIQKLCDGTKFKMLTWINSHEWWYSVLSKKQKVIFEDPRVVVVLVEQEGNYNR